jgi:hypothetical protein
LICFPPNTTHILQPCDVALFNPLKGLWHTRVDEWASQKPENTVTVKNVAHLLNDVWQKLPLTQTHWLKLSLMVKMVLELVDCTLGTLRLWGDLIFLIYYSKLILKIILNLSVNKSVFLKRTLSLELLSVSHILKKTVT